MSASHDPKLVTRGRELVDAAKPRVERFMDRARPEVEKAARAATDYAREHEDEIKVAVAKVLRARVPGPLRLAIDAVARKSEQRLAVAKATPVCTRCREPAMTGARFCTKCGAALG